MRILYLSQYFPPEVGATQTRAYEMAQGLVKSGHQVTVITEIPNHPIGIIPPQYRGKLYERTDLDGIDVIRVWVKTSPQKNFVTRMAFYLSYMIMAVMVGIFLARGKYDIIYATSPPLFAGGAGLTLSWIRRIPLIFEVRDLWPESAIVLGELRNSWAIKLATWLEESCYRRARKIIVVTKSMQEKLLNRGVSVNKLECVFNGANPELFSFQSGNRRFIREKLELQDKFIVGYAGIYGIAQGLEFIVKTATLLENKKDIHFVFVGDGPVREDIIDLADSYSLNNITFHPQVPRSEIPKFLSAFDVSLVPLRKVDLFQGALPSKMFDSWACECPTLITVPGEARQVLTESEAGLFVEPENSAKLAESIEYLRNNAELCRQMGVNGRQAVVKNYSRQALAKQVVQILQKQIDP